MTDWWRDPGSRATAVLIVVAAVGLIALAAAWWGLSDERAVPLEVPWMVSGGLGGAALLGAGLGFLDIHLERRRRARDRADLAVLIDEMYALVAGVVERR